VAVADFDEDGKEDLVVASNGSGQITFLRGVGAGYDPTAFAPVPASTPRAVATADFNFDGHADVVAALGSAGLVQLFLGNGNGAFTPGVALAAGTNASAVAVGDFNGDGAPDVAVASENGSDVRVYLGDGKGGLALAATLTAGINAPRALAAADFDGDGRLDLAVANSGGRTVSLFKGNGNGTFGTFTPSTQTVGNAPWGIAAADLNGDGRPDLVTADHGDGTVSVLLAAGPLGSFAARAAFTVDSAPSAVTALDLTADGKTDIAVVTGTHTLDLLVGNGSGGFTLSRPLPLPAPPLPGFPVRTNPQGFAAVDADGDGHPDLAIACKGSDSVVVLLAQPAGPQAFAAAARIVVGQAPMSAVAADLHGNGHLDVAVANSQGNSISFLTNDGGGNFTVEFTANSTSGVGASPQAIVAADFNLDGCPDLAATSATTDKVSLLLTSGTPCTPAVPGLTGGTYTFGSQDAGAVPDHLAVGDFNGDGWPDLAVTNKQTAGSVRVLLNDRSGGFTTSGPFAVGNTPTSIVAADLDGDGFLDLAVANENSDTVTVLWGNGSGGFPATSTLPLLPGDTKPVSVTAGDFNGDGRLDLAAAVFNTSNVALFANAGSRSFSTPSDIAAVDLPLFVTATQGSTPLDLNRDGTTDLAVVADGLKVLRGKSGMAFEPDENFVAGRGTRALAVGDFNGDSLPDVAAVNTDSNDVSILLNTLCSARRIAVSSQPAACGTGDPPYALQARVRAFDDGGNKAACAAGTVTAQMAAGPGTLGGVLTAPLSSGEAVFDALTIDAPGRHDRLRFDLPGVGSAISRSFTLGLQVAISGPTQLCPSGPGSTGLFSVGTGYDSYLWTIDAVPSFFTPSITVSGSLLAPGMSHTLAVGARCDGCLAPDSKDFYVGTLASVAISSSGVSTVCVDCIGGTLTAVETGGGPVLSRQWSFRDVALGTTEDMPGETGATYVIKGSSFPGPGDYDVFVTTTPTCGSAVTSTPPLRVTVLAKVPSGEVQALAATSRGSSALDSGENLLQWVNSTGAPDEVLVRWNKAPDGTSNCIAPGDPVAGTVSGEARISLTGATTSQWPHTGLRIDTAYCYSVFVKTGPSYSPGRVIIARPFDATGPVKWAYSTAATAVAPPVVSGSVLAMSNDRTVHSVTRGSAGGVWPANWVPATLNGVVHSRSPVVPFLIPVTRNVLFAGDDTGLVYAVDATTGQYVWPTPFSAAAPVTGAPGGLFQRFGGVRDIIVVGTANVPSALLGLDLTTGSLLGSFTGDIGAILGTPALDYSTNRVYFTSRKYGSGGTVWCLQIGVTPLLSFVWSRDLGDIDASPVLRNGRVYAMTNAGVVYSLDADKGLVGDDRTYTPTPPDGAVRGFLFPDRRNDNLIFATATKLWSVADTAPGPITLNWSWTQSGLSPSVVLYWPGTSLAYIGSTNGRLYELDFSNATSPSFKSVVLGDGTDRIGAPSLDTLVGPPDVPPGKKMLLVGSESGVLYGVEIPLP
jgi:hypothetical protein